MLELPKGTTPNYPGSLVAHANGKLYAVATATLFEIDPETFEITRSLRLPLNPGDPTSTIYNTLQVSARNGDLLLKTAPQQGNGLLVAIDVERIAVRSQLATALSSARMTSLVQGDTEYVYLPGDTDTLRFTVTDDGFTPDPSWSAPYRTADDGTKPGVAMTPTGDHDTVVFPDNNTVLVGVTAPLEVLWQSTTEPGSGVSSVNATMTDLPGGSFAPPPADPFDDLGRGGRRRRQRPARRVAHRRRRIPREPVGDRPVRHLGRRGHRRRPAPPLHRRSHVQRRRAPTAPSTWSSPT